MKHVELYSNVAKHIIVNIPNLKESTYEDNVDEIFSAIDDKGFDVERITDTYIDTEDGIANFFILDGGEVKVFEFDIKNNEPEMNINEHLVFTREMAEKFNKEDFYGSDPFKEGDEIKVGGISHIYGEPHTIRYRLDTYIVRSEPIEINLGEDNE